MKSIFLKIMWVLSSLLLIVMGFICAINPSLTIGSIAIFLGLVVLVSGISDIITYVKVHDLVVDSGFMLAEGILSVILALLILFNHVITALTIPLIFTIWIIFAGVIRIINSFDFKKLGIKNWYLILIVGILLVVIGFISIFKPMIATIAISLIVGCILISQGLDSLVKGYYINKVIKHLKEITK